MGINDSRKFVHTSFVLERMLKMRVISDAGIEMVAQVNAIIEGLYGLSFIELLIVLAIFMLMVAILFPLFSQHNYPKYYNEVYENELVALKIADSIEGHATFCIFGGSAEIGAKDIVRFMAKDNSGNIRMKRMDADIVSFHEIESGVPRVRITTMINGRLKVPTKIVACDIYVPASAVVHEIKVGLD